jgi:hypothetical protein
MRQQIFKVKKTPGFRLNLMDIIFLLFLLAVSTGCKAAIPNSSLFWIPIYLAVSFFLFCNVFRIGNRLEPVWYVPFTLVACYGVYTMNMFVFWIIVLFFLEPLKWILIFIRMKKGPYVGILHQKINTSYKVKPCQNENNF